MNIRTNSQPNSPRRGVSWAAAVCVTALASSALVATGSLSAAPVVETTTLVDDPATAATTPGATLEAGTYEISDPLILSEGQTIAAAVPGTVTIQKTGPRESAIEVVGANVTISGVTITGGSNSNGSGGGINIARGASLTLIDSTVTLNDAREGGGIYNAGELTIESSTIDNNWADRKGGGLRSDGTTSIVNSTFNANIASQGGAISSAGRTDIVQSTIVGNVATSSSSAGVDRNGGTLTVRYSIIGNNLRTNGSPASDCSGTPDLLGLNLVSDDSGCNPVGTIDVADPNVGALTKDNGGPTATMALLESSPALDRIPATGDTCASGVTVDQRGQTRVSGDNTLCDLGAYEDNPPLQVTASLGVDTKNYVDQRDLPEGTVEVGATSVAIQEIASELAASTIPQDADGATEEEVEAARLYRIGLYRIGLYRIAAQGVSLDDLDDTAGGQFEELRQEILASVSLIDIAERAILASGNPERTALPEVPLTTIPLLANGGWNAVLSGTDFAGLPPQSITLEDLAANATARPAVESLTLADVDLTASALNDIGIGTLLLSAVPLNDVPFGDTSENIEFDDPEAGYAAAWCEALFSAEECTTDFVTEVGAANMWEAQLSGAAVNQIPTLEVPLGQPSSLQDAGLYRIGLYRIGLYRIGLYRIGLYRIGLYRIFLENSALQGTRLYRIAERTAPADEANGLPEVTIGDILKCEDQRDPCSSDPSNTLTLADVAASCPTVDTLGCLLQPDASIGQLIDLLGVEDADGATLLDGLNLYDLLLAFLPPADIPWESVDLEAAGLQNIADPLQPTFDYVTTVGVANGPAQVDVTLDLPRGFAVAGEVQAQWCDDTGACVGVDAVPDPRPDPASNTISYSIAGAQSGSHELRVPVRAGLTVGTFTASSSVSADGPNGTPPPVEAGMVDVNVVAAANGGPNTAPTLSDGQLALGHIGSDEDFDVYDFTAPAGSTGASARILLSNVPEDVDYDLAVYSERPPSLRGEPVDELTTISDTPFDLNPSDDILPPDVVNDIAIDLDSVTVPGLDATDFVLRDLSSRRSNFNEEVTVPGLVEGDRYIVVVSTYFSTFSPEPYGLRVRLDGSTAAPECAASPYLGIPTASTEIPVEVAVDSGINTLYITNRARLDHELGASAGAQPTSDEIIAEIENTEGVNGVDAGLLLLDNLDGWADWDANPCDVDARNALVTEIGVAIDTANGPTGADGGIENLVIVGGDGVVPMAAIPDLTVYANESTFANDALGASGRSNAVSGAMASSYFLSDDPYATEQGIEILGGDHELYLPSLNVGRLVETGAEILGQLRNFSDYGGNLDPSTLTGTALVTGYDFLDDGASEIVGELSADFDVTALQGDEWTKDDLLPEFDAPADFDVFSTNAHYDFEALLPAAADAVGTYTDDDLVATSDFDETNTPIGALGFVVGCHAGLSMSDVQLGLTGDASILDWAQLYGRNSTQWVAHTTFGYGDSDLVAYSERLASVFAGKVAEMKSGVPGAPVSLGQALREAKQDFLGGTLVLTPYDEKIMQSWTYYGMPMFALGDGVSGGTTETTTTTSTSNAPTGFAAPAALLGQATGPVTFGPALADGTVPVSIDLTGELDENVVEGRGTFYSVDDNTVAAPYRPSQPLVDAEIPGAVPGQFGGFLITALSTTDFGPDYVPYISRPLIDETSIESSGRAADAAFPATLQRVTDTADGQRALVAAGQYYQNQQLFPKISGELIPRTPGSSDSTVPRFIDVEATNVTDAGSGAVRFDVETEVKDTNSATRVVVVYREQGQLGWESVELDGTGTGLWSGMADLVSTDPSVNVQWFAQLVDENGFVGITRNKVEYFDAVAEIQPSAPVPTITAGGNQVNGRFFSTGGTFAIGSATRFRVDEGDVYDLGGPTTITIEAIEPGGEAGYDPDTGTLRIGAGSHIIEAENAVAGTTTSFSARFFIIDNVGPTVEFSGTQGIDPATGDVMWTNMPVTLTVSASDAVVGIDDVCVDGLCASDGDGDGVAELTLESIGADDGEVLDTVVSATGSDRLGNETTITTPVRIDRATPVVAITTTPAPNAAGWNNTQVSYTVTATDVGSGIDQACLAIDTGECTLITLDANGQYTSSVQATTTLRAEATDAAGNLARGATATIEIDSTPPTGQIDTIDGDPLTSFDGIVEFGQAVDIGYGCRDASSGIASCQLLNNGNVVDSDGTYTFDARTIGTITFSVRATDLADNPSTAPTPVDILVGYRTCEDYNTNQAKKAGSAYPITVRLCDAQGNTVIVPGAVLTALTVDETNDPGPQFPGNSNEAYQFKDNGSGSYSYNIKTDGLPKGQHKLYFTFVPLPADRSTLSAQQLQMLATNVARFSTR